MAMGDVEIDYKKLCSELELQEQEVIVFGMFICRGLTGRSRFVETLHQTATGKMRICGHADLRIEQRVKSGR